MKKNFIFIVILILTFGCSAEKEQNGSIKNENHYSNLMNYNEALELFKEGMVASVYDIETGITYNVRRIEGGYQTIADVETVSKEDTQKLLSTTGGSWSIIRRAVIVTVGDKKIAASIAPFEHSGSEDYPYYEYIDNRTGATGPGVNLDYIRENDLEGVIDIYFYNSLTPIINRVDERHQEMVLKAYDYES